jgi:histidine kinase
VTTRIVAETAEREARAELDRQRAVMVRADRLRSLGELAAGMAHELYQPLTGVFGAAEQLALRLRNGREIPPEMLAERLDCVIGQAERMTHIIERVRQFARRADKREADVIDVQDCLLFGREMRGRQLNSHAIKLSLELAAGTPRVRANPYSLEEVTLNLLTNARDAIETRREGDPEAPASIRIVARPVDHPDLGDAACLEFHDTGCGMTAAEREHAFEPFVTSKGPDKGTGLGLAIARSIIEEAAGTIALESTPNVGTCVRIHLPAAPASDAP